MLFKNLLCIFVLKCKFMADKYPILSTINYPSDLRKLDKKLLKPLCQELRTFIVEQLANNPGHLASSLEW